MLKFTNYGFYEIDINYLKYLNSIDSEVYYNSSYLYNCKPFIGIIVGINKYNYFIPLTSAKEKHKNWKNIADEHLLIYEIVNKNKKNNKGIFKEFSKTENLQILSVIDIKKMIPVPDNSFKNIIFKNLKDDNYKNLLQKEYKFCLKVKDKIIKRVEKIYKEQKESKVVRNKYCNFSLCEKVMEEYIKENALDTVSNKNKRKI